MSNAYEGSGMKTIDKKNKRKKIFFFIANLLFIVLLFDVSNCFANIQGGTVVSDIVSKFHNELSRYESVMLKYAKLLFYWCAALEIAFLGIKMALGASDIKDTIKNFVMIILGAGFFLAVINNYHEWTWNVINGLKAIAGEATTLVDASDKPFTVGLELAGAIFEMCSATSPAKSLAYILAGMAILFCFALITLQIIMIKCECIVAMCASAILLGLGATSFFREYAINALRYVFAVAFKLMTMQLVMGVGINFITTLQVSDEMDWAQIGVTICFCVIFYSLVKTLPDVVSGIISGSHVSTGNALSSTVTAMGAAAVGAGTLGYAAARNIGLAARAARADGASGIGGTVRGAASNLWQGYRRASAGMHERQNTMTHHLRNRLHEAQMPKMPDGE